MNMYGVSDDFRKGYEAGYADRAPHPANPLPNSEPCFFCRTKVAHTEQQHEKSLADEPAPTQDSGDELDKLVDDIDADWWNDGLVTYEDGKAEQKRVKAAIQAYANQKTLNALKRLRPVFTNASEAKGYKEAFEYAGEALEIAIAQFVAKELKNNG